MKEKNVNENTRYKENVPGEALRMPVRNYKDRVFRMIFKNPEYALELYNAINGTDYMDPKELQIITLEHALYMGMKNDVAVLLHDFMNLFEHQASKNPNLPLRDLLYVAREYSRLTRNENLYGTALVKIPEPRFLAFYNGKEPMPEKEVLRLSDAYLHVFGEPNLELKVEVFNINKGFNEDLLERCRPLKDYMSFVDKTRMYHEEMALEKALEKSIEECIQENILEDFFRKNKAEVMEMSIFEYDEERHMEQERRSSFAQGEQSGYAKGEQSGYAKGEQSGYAKGEQSGYAKGEQSGYAKGKQRGKQLETVNSVIRMTGQGVPIENISVWLNQSPEFVERIGGLHRQYPEADGEKILEYYHKK